MMARCKFNLNTIELNKTVIDKLTVHSYEMSIYLVELEIGSDIGFVYDYDKPKRFLSSQEVRQAFENCKVLTAQMLHFEFSGFGDRPIAPGLLIAGVLTISGSVISGSVYPAFYAAFFKKTADYMVPVSN